jgi:competence protein ComFC
MTCLLCGGATPENYTLLDILTLHADETTLCRSCAGTFTPISKSFCPRCHRENEGIVCEDCTKWESLHGYQVANTALYAYNDAMHEFFSLYKFLGDYRLHKAFAKEMRAALAPMSRSGATLAPIPLSTERFQTRGFNQVSSMLDACGLPYVDLLEKIEVDKMSDKDRHSRICSENPFRMAAGIAVPEKVVIVDDIYTTGTTIYHAYQVLKNAGVADVSSFTLCR